jgi:hypothetical protein
MGAVLLFEQSSITLDNFIHTTNKYFGISDKEYTYTHNIHLFAERVKEVSVEELFNKDQLIHFIKEHTMNHNEQLLDVFISENPLEISNIKDTFGKVIFEGEYGTIGWMVFIDPCKIANWSHPCEYWFVKNNQEYLFRYDEKWKPGSEIKYIGVRF